MKRNGKDFAIMYVSDRHKAQEMCNKVILENDGMLRFIPDSYNNQKMCDKALIIIFLY